MRADFCGSSDALPLLGSGLHRRHSKTFSSAIDSALQASSSPMSQAYHHRKQKVEQARRAVKEYLATLDDPAYGAASSVTPKFVSPSDPAAQWTGALRNAAFFAYADNYLIDVKFGIIMDVEAKITSSKKR
jgi:hypothetical protein